MAVLDWNQVVANGAVASAMAAGACVLGLWTIGIRSWHRTRRLRRGGRPPPDLAVSGGSDRSSHTTWVAASGGVALLCWGLLSVAGVGRVAFAAALAGAGIATSGIRSRVTRLEVRDRGMVVHRAFRPPIAVPWESVERVRPPRTPVGGWRVDAGRRSMTLMPSDILGHEAVLDLAVERAGLWFGGRSWSKPGEPTDRS